MTHSTKVGVSPAVEDSQRAAVATFIPKEFCAMLGAFLEEDTGTNKEK